MITHPGTSGNKKLVTDFYNEFYTNHNLDAAVKYVRIDLKQHRANVEDGRQAMVDDHVNFLKQFPRDMGRVQHVVAEGNLVIVHTTGGEESIVDIWRIENGKLVEHWDVREPVAKVAAEPNKVHALR